jgi:FkbM family methyltransferase
LLENLIAEQLLERIYDRPPVGIRTGDVVVDVGGYLGTFTRFALMQGADKVVVFEPEPTNIECFKKTFSDEIGQGLVILVEAAAWEKREELRFALDPTDPNTGMGRVRGDGHLTVQGVTIDDTLAELGITTVDFIKMDIEGAERHALAGAHATLSTQAPRMALCVYHRGDDREVIPERVLAIRSSYEILMGPDQAYFYDQP